MLSNNFLLLASLIGSAWAFPNLSARQYPVVRASSSDDSQKGGVVIKTAPKITNTKTMPIPDDAHPYRAPGDSDQRGPCPGLNTLANHGYIPRNGIASFEEIVLGVQEGFNMDHDIASALAAFGMLARGNAFTNQLSIGGASSLVPPLPGEIDGPETGGLAKHGRMEGDVSMTRKDAGIGDNVHFQDDLYDILLTYVGQFGNDSTVTGNRSVVTSEALTEFKYRRFVDDQRDDPNLQYHAGRFILSYGEAQFTLTFFANGTTGTLSTQTMGSFFRNQTFPENWHRHDGPAGINNLVDVPIGPHPEVVPGANGPDGKYVPDASFPNCTLYQTLAVQNIPAVLVNTTGILKQNFDFLANTIFALFNGTEGCVFTNPTGAAGV